MPFAVIVCYYLLGIIFFRHFKYFCFSYVLILKISALFRFWKNFLHFTLILLFIKLRVILLYCSYNFGYSQSPVQKFYTVLKHMFKRVNEYIFSKHFATLLESMYSLFLLTKRDEFQNSNVDNINRNNKAKPLCLQFSLRNYKLRVSMQSYFGVYLVQKYNWGYVIYFYLPLSCF